jgi:hypothetical protein
LGKSFLYILLFIVPLKCWAQDSLVGIWQDEPVWLLDGATIIAFTKIDPISILTIK